MRKEMRRVYLAISALVVFTLLIMACGGDDDATPAATQAPAPTQAPAASGTGTGCHNGPNPGAHGYANGNGYDGACRHGAGEPAVAGGHGATGASGNYDVEDLPELHGSPEAHV